MLGNMPKVRKECEGCDQENPGEIRIPTRDGKRLYSCKRCFGNVTRYHMAWLDMYRKGTHQEEEQLQGMMVSVISQYKAGKITKEQSDELCEKYTTMLEQCIQTRKNIARAYNAHVRLRTKHVCDTRTISDCIRD